MRRSEAIARRALHRGADWQSAVSQVGNLRGGGESIGVAKIPLHSPRTSAGYQPATQQTASLRYIGGEIVSGLDCHPGQALLHFQSSGRGQSFAATGFPRM